MNIQSLDHLVLTVTDIEASIKFYCGILGMKHVQFGDKRHALKFGEQKINLHQANNIIQPAAQLPTIGSADLCFIVNTPIKDIIVELDNADIKVIEGPVKRTGATGDILSIYIRDLDMNLIELSNCI